MNIVSAIRSKIVRTPSTDNAVRAFTEALDELNAVVVSEDKEIDRLQHQLNVTYEKQDAARERRSRAHQLSRRFSEFLID